MIPFHNLKYLANHHHFLQKKLKSQHFFLVGGAIRDILLGIEKKPIDIDLTMAGNPEKIYQTIDTEQLSHFITEKYGTITLIPHQEGETIKYELTPLRAETGYDDFRHPTAIQRSNNLIEDSQRRDFTINAIYYSTAMIKAEEPKEQELVDDDMILKILAKEGYIFLADSQTLIVQKPKLIEQLFPDAKLDTDILYYLIDIQSKDYVQKAKPQKQQKTMHVHILIDPQLGIQDNIARKLQTVGAPDQRFQEDALRLLRGIRLINVINQKLLNQQKKWKNPDPKNKIRLFDFETETRKAVKRNHALLGNIAKERIKEEIFKAFTKGNPFGCIALIDEAEILPLLFPALALTKHVDQPIRYHPFDVYSHILLTVHAIQELNSNPLVRFAMLYHDVGKVWQYAEYQKELSKEEIKKLLAGPLNHRHSSTVLAEEDFKQLGFSKKEREEIQRYIREHHTPGEILLANPENRTKKLRKLYSENGFERINNLLDINIADRVGMFNPLQNADDLSDSRALKKILIQIQEEEGQFTAKDLAVKGKDIMEYFQLAPGKIIGELLQVALDRVLGDIKNRNKPDQIFANLSNYLKQRKE